MKPLTQDFRKLIEARNKHRVEYLLIGGYAVGIHGQARYTKDFHVWVGTDRSNAERLAPALDEFCDLGATPDQLAVKELLVRLGVEPNMVDILGTIAGVEFGPSYERRLTIDYHGTPIDVISLRDLRTNKLATGRSQDAADVDNLPDPDDPESMAHFGDNLPR
ncbi:MAG: hypothetical protein AAF823_03330 [Planctomycetota bacterium]